MQRNPSNLKEARYRRLVGKGLLCLIALPLFDYAFFLASGGYRDVFGIGHWNLVIAGSLLLIAFAVMKPVFRLEEPFQYQLAQRRKAQRH
jgi:hypothetical protein